MAPETLANLKTFLRINHSKLDDEIRSDVDACLLDLKMHGIILLDVEDPLIYNAVKLYCKANYIDDVTKSAEYVQRYRELRDCLKCAEGYGWGVEDDD